MALPVRNVHHHEVLRTMGPNMKTTAPFALVLPLLLAPLGAQAPPNLIGLTRLAPTIDQHDFAACAPLPNCPAPGMPPAGPLPPWAGGTAWDPTRSQVWVSSGLRLASYDMAACAPLCPPVPCPTSTPNAFCTGLAFVESLNQLWVIDSQGVILQCQTGCPPTIVAMCNTGLAPGANSATTGLAVDEGRRLVFYSYSDFTTGMSIVNVASIGTPCQIFHRERVPACAPGAGFGAVTGLGVDWCRQVLYLTDGRTTQAWRYAVAPGPSITFTPIGCCTVPTPGPIADPLIGLCVRPGGATALGAPCANGTCPACPMAHVLRNEPNLGNASFTLGLDNAPSGRPAWCLIGAGPCTAPGALVPPICGPILLPVLLGNLGPAIMGGGGACGGTANFALPLPVIPSLCGTVLSSQCVVLCPGALGLGTALSPCLSWRLQGS